jgi:hypothetical protein
MAQLPRYQRLGLQTRQPGNIDFADTREQARYAQTLAQQLDRMSDFAFKKSAEMAVERGQERVREEGALPTLEAIEAKGGPRGIAEKAAVEAANRIAVVEIETLATADMQKLIVEADESNMSMPAYQAAMADINDGYKASLQMVDPVAAGVLGARLLGASSKYETRYSEVVTRKAKAAWAEKVNITATTKGNAILDLATSPGATEEALTIEGQQMFNDLVSLGVSEKNAQSSVDETLKKAVRQNRFYVFDSASDFATKQALLERYQANPLPGYSYEGNRAFLRQLQGSFESQVGQAQKIAVSDLIAAQTAMELTGEPPSGFKFDEASINDIFPPEQAEEYIESWNNSVEDAENRGALAYMSGDNVDAITIELEAEERSARDSGDPAEITQAVKRKTAWLESVANRNERINKDPAGFVAATNESAGKMINNIMDQFSRGDVNEAVDGLLLLRTIVDGQHEELGVPPNMRNVMPNQMAAQVVNVIQNIPSDVASQALEAITQQLGDYSPRFIEELRRQGLKPEYIQAMYASNPAVKKELIDISVMKVDDILDGLPRSTKSDVEDAITVELEGYRKAYLSGGGNEANKIFNQQIETVEKIAISRLKDGTYKTITEAVESALEDLIPEYQQSVNEPNGAYVVPMAYNPQTIRYNVGMLMDEMALSQLGIEPLESSLVPDFVDEAVSLASLSSTGRFLNNSTGDGLSLHYVVNGTELPAGFEVKFSELPALVSRLYSGEAITEEAAGFRREGLIQAGIEPADTALQDTGSVDPNNPRAAEIQRLIEENK